MFFFFGRPEVLVWALVGTGSSACPCAGILRQEGARKECKA